jgi:hypothetical protein
MLVGDRLEWILERDASGTFGRSDASHLKRDSLDRPLFIEIVVQHQENRLVDPEKHSKCRADPNSKSRTNKVSFAVSAPSPPPQMRQFVYLTAPSTTQHMARMPSSLQRQCIVAHRSSGNWDVARVWTR